MIGRKQFKNKLLLGTLMCCSSFHPVLVLFFLFLLSFHSVNLIICRERGSVCSSLFPFLLCFSLPPPPPSPPPSFFSFFFFLCCCYYCCCWSSYLPICANLLRFHLGARVSLFLSVPAYSVGLSVSVSGYVPTFLPVTNYFRIYLRDRISTYLSACAKILPYLSRCPYTFLPVEKLFPYLSRCPYYLPIYIGVRISTYLSACDNLPPYLSRSLYIYLPFCL